MVIEGDKLHDISERKELIDVALGRASPDLVIKGGNLDNVYTREIYEANVAIKNVTSC